MGLGLVNPAVQSYNASGKARGLVTFNGKSFTGRAGDAVTTSLEGDPNLGPVMIRDLCPRVVSGLTFDVAGLIDSRTATTMTPTGSPDWVVNAFVGFTLTAGASTAVITANTSGVLTFAGGWVGGTPAVGAAYTITVPTAGATCKLGIDNADAAFIANTDATLLTTGKLWASTTPNAYGIVAPATARNFMLNDTLRIIITPGTVSVQGGSIEVVVFWDAIASGASIPNPA